MTITLLRIRLLRSTFQAFCRIPVGRQTPPGRAHLQTAPLGSGGCDGGQSLAGLSDEPPGQRFENPLRQPVATDLSMGPGGYVTPEALTAHARSWPRMIFPVIVNGSSLMKWT